MVRNINQLIEDGERARENLDHPDPDLRALARTVVAQGQNYRIQRDAVWAARRNGKTWTQISVLLDCTRQNAKAVFGEPDQ